MLLKPSATLRNRGDTTRGVSGDTVFRFFLALSLIGCLWTTVVQPHLPDALHWLGAVIAS